MLFFQKKIREFNTAFDNTKTVNHAFVMILLKSLNCNGWKNAGKANIAKEHTTTIKHDLASLNFIKNSCSDFMFEDVRLDGLLFSLELFC